MKKKVITGGAAAAALAALGALAAAAVPDLRRYLRIRRM
ncbi:MAG: hypothetical protein QOF84_1347 [Streptomyces sp.]|jgi:hypothetical protein|nr:hypothetical protein [Streptomyces sp.]MDX6346557.1 hypothetical protein [Streptomyces sp.]